MKSPNKKEKKVNQRKLSDEEIMKAEQAAFAVQTYLASLGFAPLNPVYPGQQLDDKISKRLGQFMETDIYERLMARKRSGELTKEEFDEARHKAFGQWYKTQAD